MSRPKDSFYVTTPIYYVNDVPHIGHAYTTVAADCLARYKRLKLGADNVFFLTGTDEHGQKVEKAASALNLSSIEFVDAIVPRFKDLWQRLDISNDAFIRTTEERHIRAATKLWETCAAKGDIYLGEYEDWYCTPCENFLTETQLQDGKCPDCKRPVDRLKEKSYFFKLSAYGDRLLKHIEANPGFIQPDSKRNEILSFLKDGLRDLSVSRTSFKWGIPVPGDPDHVMYVWFDALTNYLAATGFPDEGPKSRFWPADCHIIGKDILRFHAVYWPAFLMSAGIPLPQRVHAHGWWTIDGQKMSKSKGNVVDPNGLIDVYGTDAFRYFLLREVPFGLDGDFSMKALVGRINSELANDLGNLLSRSVSMIEKYRDSFVPVPDPSRDRDDLEARVKGALSGLKVPYESAMEGLEFSDALARIWACIREMNGFVDKSAPWKEKDEETLSNVLYTLAEGLRLIAVYVYPFMPSSAQKIWEALGIDRRIEGSVFDEETVWQNLLRHLEVAEGFECTRTPGQRVRKTLPLFPRLV
mgnify:CR=1 FL=1